MKYIFLMLFALELVPTGIISAQMSTGAISGIVTDGSGARISVAHITISSKKTGLNQVLVTSHAGDYFAPALVSGLYDVTAEATGFKQTVRQASVETGNTTTVNFAMQVGSATETLNVTSTSPQMRYQSHEISGTITHPQIEGLPINGRNVLELVKLEPGAQQPSRTSNNRTLVPLLGSPAGQNGRSTRITVDGGSVMEVGNGGSAMGFSLETVQEFQVSSANFDLSTGVTASGAVNIATRSGGNEFHGSGLFFLRDHHLSAYPALHRDPSNPNPFFQRKQFGVALGGPIHKDRVFFFGAFERLDQRGVVSTELLTPDFAALSRTTRSPTYVNQVSARADVRLTEKNFLFIRYSHEGSFSYGPGSLGIRAYPSSWPTQTEWADQSVLGFTTHLSDHLVNDAHFSFFFVSFAQYAAKADDCPRCLGIGAPSITVNPSLFLGVSSTTAVLGRRYHLNDALSWQKGLHHIRIGGDWETTRGGRTNFNDEPVTMSLFSPQEVRDFNTSQSSDLQIALPTTFLTLQDILRLPLQSFTVGIGDPFAPQAGFGNARISSLVHVFYQDTWRLHPRLVVNYGMSWTYDAPLNYDLSKPAYLESLLGVGELKPTRKNWKNFSPSLGFAWNLKDSGKTVIRAGAGTYYDFQVATDVADEEGVSLGPRGTGRGSYFGGGVRNPLTDVPGVSQGTLLDFSSPTQFTGGTLLVALPEIRAQLLQSRGDPANRDFSVTNIEADKQGFVVAQDLPSPSALHLSVGLQRELAHDLVFSADFVVRKFRHIGPPPGLIDANRFSSVHGPILPICSDSESTDPRARCSLGPISVTSGLGSATYKGLLVRAEKRLSRGLQFVASYAYSSNAGDNFANGFNNDLPSQNKGPLDRDVSHILNLSGLAQLPKRFRIGLFVTYVSKPPVSAYLGDLDLNGDGTSDDLLPGSKVNQFNRGLGKQDLQRLVNSFNAVYAGKEDAQGSIIPSITLPSKFEFGDSFLTQDLRLSRDFSFPKHWHITLIGEAFNLFNIGNLVGRSGDLLAAGFGQPTSRVTQVFGSGGPRAFQVAVRASF